MSKLQKILAMSPEDRSDEELQYLIDHEDQLTEEMKAQLEEETNVLESYEADFVSKGLEKLTKNVGKKIVRSFTSTVKDLGDGMMEAIISSEAEDRHGEVLEMKGLDVKEYMKNPIISYQHDWSVPSIGRTHRLTKTKDGKLKAEFEWAIKNDLKQIHDKARLMYELYKEKFQFAFSIEFIPKEVEGNRFTKAEMIGFAPVVVPANPEALLLAKKKGLDKEYREVYNISMDIKVLLKKIKEEGVESLTLSEVKYLREHKEDLTGKQIKSLASIFEEKQQSADNEVMQAVKSLAESVKAVSESVEAIKNEDKGKVKDIASDPNEESFAITSKYKMFGQTKVSKNLLDDKGEPNKEIKFLHYVRGLRSGNFSQYLDVVGKDAMNTSDDSQVIPPAEFIVEIERLEEEVGVAARDANVRRSTKGAGLIYVLGNTDLAIYDTAEGAAKTSSQLSYAQKTLAWRKFAGILPITDELTEDSAFDLWTDAVQRFARAYAEREDQLVFTETAAGGNTKNGILNESGVNTVTMTGDGFADITYDDLVDMIYGVPSSSGKRGKFYLNRDILPHIMKLKDDEGRPLWIPSVRDGAPATILGRPYEETEVMPGTSDDDASTAFMVYGYLGYSTLGLRTDIQLKMFDSGTVGDPDEEDQDANTLNLLTQDIMALRAVKRMNAVVRFPAAFSVLKTGASS